MPLEYPELYGNYPPISQQPYTVKGINLFSDNKNCLLCGNYLLEKSNQSIVFMPCNHAYHGHCVKNFLFSEENKECPLCHPAIDLKADKQFLTDEEMKKRRDFWRNKYNQTNLSYWKRRKLIKTPWKKPWKIFRTKIDRQYIDNNNITIHDLINAKLDILDIYFSLKLKELGDLQDIGFDINSILLKDNSIFPISKLIDLYAVHYKDLANLGFNIKHIKTLKLEPFILQQLGIDINSLLKNDLTKKMFKEYHFAMKECQEFLDMDKEHFFKLHLNKNDVEDMNWNIQQVCNTFNFSNAEKIKIGFVQDPQKNENSTCNTISISNYPQKKIPINTRQQSTIQKKNYQRLP